MAVLTTVRRVRRATVAGLCYPADAAVLRDTVERLASSSHPRISCVGAVIPHGGYHYSGAVAGQTLGRVAVPRRCVILAPNHTGAGPAWSLMPEGAYATPLGEVAIDEPLAQAFVEACPLLEADGLAHRGEHAIEVALPFLQVLAPEGLTIVPVVIGSEQADEVERVAQALAGCLARETEPVLVVASADLSHYEPRDAVADKDAQMLEAILALETAAFLQRMRDLRVTTCAGAPIACLLATVRRLGASVAELVRYATSAEAGGDPQSATGYAGVVFH